MEGFCIICVTIKIIFKYTLYVRIKYIHLFMKKAVIKFKLKKEHGNNLNLKGVYCFWFTGYENLLYVGCTRKSFKQRLIQHLISFNKGTCKPHTHRIYCLAMSNSFNFKILEIVEKEEIVLLREQYYIGKLNPKLNKNKNNFYIRYKNYAEKLDKIND